MILFLSNADVKEVRVEGVAAIKENRKDIARDQAIKDALRKAVEQAVGSFISSETVVENYQVISDRIYSKAEGYIADYKVLREKVEDDLYRVLISAKVKMGDIKDDLKAIGILVEYMGRPRIAVLLEDDDIRTAIEEHLVNLGFPVVDFETIAKNTQKDKLKAVFDGDEDLAKEIALRNGAEIFITGSSKVDEKNYRGRSIYEVVVRAKVVVSSTGEIISSRVVSKSIPFDEVKAKLETSKEMAEKISDDILKKWKGGVNVIYLKVSGIKRGEINTIKGKLSENIRGLRGINTKEIRKNYVVYEITASSTPQEVLDEISSLKEFEVVRFEGSEIEVKYRK